MATSTGRGYSYGAKLPRDNASVGIIDSYARREARRQEREGARALATLDDFSIDYSKWLPAWGREAATIHTDLVNKFNTYLTENPRTAANRIQLDAVEAKRKVGELFASNNAAMGYGKLDGSKYYVENDLVSETRNPKSTFGSISEVAKKYKLKGINADDTGLFSAPLVERADVVAKFEPAVDYDEEVVRQESAGIPNHVRVWKQLRTTPAAIDRETMQNKANPKIALALQYEMSDAEKQQAAADQSGQVLDSLLTSKIKERVIKQAPVGGMRFNDEQFSVPQPTAAERDRQPRVSGNTVTLGNAKWSYYSDGNKETWTPSRTDVTENKVFDFTDKDGKLVSGRVRAIESVKGGTPEIKIVIKEKRIIKDSDPPKEIDVDIEKTVPYRGTEKGYNIGKIKNEYNADPYMIRKLVTGSLEVPKGEIVGTTATGVKSNTGGGSETKKFPLPEGKAYRGKKNGVWYVWSEDVGKYVKE